MKTFGLKKFILALTLAATGSPIVYSQRAFDLSGAYWGTHDPSIAKQGKTWYVFATGKAPQGGQFAIRCSDNLTDWRACGQVFDAIPDWIRKRSPGTTDLWAPDISFYKGEYRLYFAYSLFGKNLSGIALATNKTLDPQSPDYKWTDHGLVLESTAENDYNAIDPNFIVDVKGRSWLAFGSFWSGIKLRCLDDTGKVSAEDQKLYSIAARREPLDAAPAKPGLPPDWEAIEAPFVVHHGGHYYLFVSWDLCCKGAKSTYRTMVGRATEVTGPYLDEQGNDMAVGGGTQILSANGEWVGPGGESLLLGKPDDLIVFHAYDAVTGKPALQISTIRWTKGWPQAALAAHHEPAPR